MNFRLFSIKGLATTINGSFLSRSNLMPLAKFCVMYEK
jgi:hypothetical protein